jgi:hypothetical protein
MRTFVLLVTVAVHDFGVHSLVDPNLVFSGKNQHKCKFLESCIPNLKEIDPLTALPPRAKLTPTEFAAAKGAAPVKVATLDGTKASIDMGSHGKVAFLADPTGGTVAKSAEVVLASVPSPLTFKGSGDGDLTGLEIVVIEGGEQISLVTEKELTLQTSLVTKANDGFGFDDATDPSRRRLAVEVADIDAAIAGIPQGTSYICNHEQLGAESCKLRFECENGVQENSEFFTFGDDANGDQYYMPAWINSTNDDSCGAGATYQHHVIEYGPGVSATIDFRVSYSSPPCHVFKENYYAAAAEGGGGGDGVMCDPQVAAYALAYRRSGCMALDNTCES